MNQTLTAPGFGPPGVHPQAFGPSWAGALIIKAEAVEGADKLLRLTLDIGDEQRNVFSGLNR